MGAFFVNQYDLYKAIKTNPVEVSALLRRAISMATGEDFEQDLKDSCVGINEHKKYDFAFSEVNLLWKFLQEKLAV